MNYELVQHSDGAQFDRIVTSIKETQTDQWVAIGLRDMEARKVVKRLNLGAAFDGWTPPFFLERILGRD